MRFFAVLARKCGALLYLPALDLLLLPVVFIALGLARGAVLALPFRFYAPLMGKRAPLDAKPFILKAHQASRAKRIGYLVRAVSRITPWKSLCLPQAMVAAGLMRFFRIPHVTYFGLAKHSNKNEIELILAHAWVKVQDTTITGGQRHTHFTVVAALVYGN